MKDIFNEMDYRNIPQDMLDKNIPTGRGMVKWAPFVICTNLIKKSNLIGFKHNIYVNYVWTLYLFIFY